MFLKLNEMARSNHWGSRASTIQEIVTFSPTGGPPFIGRIARYIRGTKSCCIYHMQ